MQSENKHSPPVRRLRRHLLIAGVMVGLLAVGITSAAVFIVGTNRENPEICEFKVISASFSPVRLKFSLRIDPGKASISASESECWVCFGDPTVLEQLLPLLKEWNSQEGGGPASLRKSGEVDWAGRCTLRQATEKGVWEGELNVGYEMTLTQSTAPLSIVLLDDGGTPSNQLSVWVDFGAAKVASGPNDTSKIELPGADGPSFNYLGKSQRPRVIDAKVSAEVSFFGIKRTHVRVLPFGISNLEIAVTFNAEPASDSFGFRVYNEDGMVKTSSSRYALKEYSNSNWYTVVMWFDSVSDQFAEGNYQAQLFLDSGEAVALVNWRIEVLKDE